MKSYEIGVYYFPNYHIDARNEAVHGAQWTEWELVKQAQPRFAARRAVSAPMPEAPPVIRRVFVMGRMI